MSSYYTKPTYLAPQTRARSSDINALNDAAAAAFNAIPVTSQSWSGVQDFSGGTLRAATPIQASDVTTMGWVNAALLAAGKGPVLPAIGTFVVYSVAGNLVTKTPGPMGNAMSLAQSRALNLSM